MHFWKPQTWVAGGVRNKEKVSTVGQASCRGDATNARADTLHHDSHRGPRPQQGAEQLTAPGLQDRAAP